MLVKLYALDSVDPLIKEQDASGVCIRRILPPEKHILVHWAREEFNEKWASECDVAFTNHPVSCFVAVERERVVGFACYNATAKGFFGPEGVAETSRRRGIGKALALRCLHAMAEDGYAYAIIGAAGPTDFYAKAVKATVIEGSTPGIYQGMLKG